MQDGYAPGFGRDALEMMSARSATDRARFVFPLLRNGMRVLDVGCGPGSITAGLAVTGCRVLGVDAALSRERLVRATPSSTVDFIAASVYALPLPDGCADLVFAHALFEHLSRPAAALAELRRVLRPGGALALSTSDWSRARLRPRTANVDAALRGHYLLRRRAGGDPFAGKHLPGHVADAGFREIRTHARYRPDLTYRELATYIERRLAAAVATPSPHRDQLAAAARSARAWTESTDGDFSQCWVEILATR
ncbi:class I SAM-dependent methyltransferase [Amycolatopsis anabasis]|uniref:class I SAM-dependent methyltransferase n=1 Tax=Amycolatopsis anabasis TaxID=1840409 RepID=UPI00131B9D6C|nr:class I SAM-dependent methyltransferase [Amycolatopsis anabasis]